MRNLYQKKLLYISESRPQINNNTHNWKLRIDLKIKTKLLTKSTRKKTIWQKN